MTAAVVVVPAQRAPSPDHASEWALVERARAGDRAAFADLYATHHAAVLRFVRYRTHCDQLAQDLTADVFLRAIRSIEGVEYQGRAIGAWFNTIARNIVFDHYKSVRYRLEWLGADVGVDQVDLDHGPEETVVRDRLAVTIRTEVRAAVAKLPAEQARCVQSRIFDGLSVADTAAALGKNEGAVKALMHRALRTLLRIAPELGDLR